MTNNSLASIHASASLLEWFDDIADARAAIRYCQGKIFFATEKEGVNHFKKSILELPDDKIRDILYCLIDKAPWAYRSNNQSFDFVIDQGHPEYASLSQIERDSLLDPLLARRSDIVSAGESFDKAFNRKLGPYLGYCQTLTLVDPYAGKSIIDGQKKDTRFLDALLKNRDFNLTIHTSVIGKSAREEEARKIINSIKEHLETATSFAGDYSIFVYAKTTKFHHRRLGLGFRKGGIAFLLETSVNGLGDEHFKEASSFPTIDFKDFGHHLTGLQQGVSLVASFKNTEDQL